MPNFSTALRRVICTASCLPFTIWVAAAQQPQASPFTFSTFSIPGVTNLSIESINDVGTLSGYYNDASGDVVSFLRTSDGTFTPYQDPSDTTVPSFTRAGQVNRSGVVGGEFYDTANATYEGYVYTSAAGTFTSYQVPGQPAATTTSINGINDKGMVCGYVLSPPYTQTNAFVRSGTTVSVFTVNSAPTASCYSVNDPGAAVGYYEDAAGVFHGFLRATDGTLTTVDVPSAATTPGTAPCVSTPVAGTVILGINNAGYLSGHYWDASYNEHGFLMTPKGNFVPIDVPGAYQTSAGGLNDYVEVTGHYTDSSCNDYGYVAKPTK